MVLHHCYGLLQDHSSITMPQQRPLQANRRSLISSSAAAAVALIVLLQVSPDGVGSETLSLSPESGMILSSNCPEYCACKWKKGKETVTCGAEAKFQKIPKIKDPGTQVSTYVTILSFIQISYCLMILYLN